MAIVNILVAKSVLDKAECAQLLKSFESLPYVPHSRRSRLPRIFRADGKDMPQWLSRLYLKLNRRMGGVMRCHPRVVANKYAPGQGARQHQDGPRNVRVWAINVGLPGSVRTMRFICKKTRRKTDIALQNGDMYMFDGDAYEDCTHGSVAKRTQVGTIYSATFRELAEHQWPGQVLL